MLFGRKRELILITTWMNLKTSWQLKEVHYKRSNSVYFLLYKMSRIGRSIETKENVWLGLLWAEVKDLGSVAKRYRFSFYVMAIFNIIYGDGYLSL